MNALLLSILFVVHHAGPAEHFAAFAEGLKKKGYAAEIYASGPALQKIGECGGDAIPFKTPEEIRRPEKGEIVITDVASEEVQKMFSEQAPATARWVYYDNPEAQVPGNYSTEAQQVMDLAQKVICANARLTLEGRSCVGLGYYPVKKAQQIAERRLTEKEALRTRLLSELHIPDKGQKIGVYFGCSHEEFFNQALPAFSKMLEEGIGNWTVVMQPHPSARGRQVELGHMVLSKWGLDDLLVAADAVFYYQTSMGPLFVIAGIPVLQVGHAPYQDILIRNGFCKAATTSQVFVEALSTLHAKDQQKAMLQCLGYKEEWLDQLILLLQESGVAPQEGSCNPPHESPDAPI